MRYKENTKIRRDGNYYIILCLLLVIETFFCFIGSVSAVVDTIMLIIFLMVFLVAYVYDTGFFLKYLWFIVAGVWGVVAVYMLENTDVVLRGKHGCHYGSFPIYVLSWLLFFEFILYLENLNKCKIKKLKVNRNYNDIKIDTNKIIILEIISYLLIIYMFVSFAQVITKPYFILGVDRYSYNESYMPKTVSFAINIFFAFMPIPIMLRKEKKWIPILYSALFALLCAWCGEKFTGLLIILYFVIICLNPVSVGVMMRNKIKKIIKWLGVAIGIMLLVVSLQQIVIGQQDLGRYFRDRIAAQGELWWLTYGQDYKNGTHMDEVSDELNVLINQPDGKMSNYNFGIYKMMKKFMNSNWVSYALSMGVRATESTRATFYYYGKLWGLFIGQLLLAFVIYRLVNACIRECNSRNWIKAVPFMYILRITITAAIMSDFYLLTQKRIIALYILLIVVGKKRFKIKE